MIGETPAVVLVDPIYPRNVGNVLRDCATFGVKQLWYTGERAETAWKNMKRLPREERLPRYNHVRLIKGRGRFLGDFGPDAVPVCVEVKESGEDLSWFVHPPNPVYVFGPEQGGLDDEAYAGYKSSCKRFVTIPSDGSLNLAVAVGIVLYDRRSKLIRGDFIDRKSAYERVRQVS